MKIANSIRDQYAGVFRRLQAWPAPTPQAQERQRNLLLSGLTLARASAAGESLPQGFGDSIARQAGELRYVGTGLAGLMALWSRSAGNLMAGSATLSGFEIASVVLPYLLIAAGVGFIVWATRDWEGFPLAA